MSHIRYVTEWGTEDFALATLVKPLTGKRERGETFQAEKSTNDMEAKQYLGVSGDLAAGSLLSLGIMGEPGSTGR